MANTPKEPPKDFIEALNEQEAVKKKEQDKAAELNAINKAGIKNVEATNRTTDAVTKGAADIKAGVTITNPDLAKTGDVASAVDAIHKLNLTTFNTNQGLPQLADNLVKLTQAVQSLQKDYETKGVAGLSKQLAALVDKLDGVSKTLSNSKVEVDSGLQKTIDNLQQSINAIEFNPSVNVKAPAAKVVATPVDLGAVEEGLKAVVAAVEQQESPETDLSPVISGLEAVQNAITSLRFPVPNFVLPFKDVNGEGVQVQLDASGNLPTTATISTGGLATSANQTGGGQKTQIVDGSGNVIGATTNALDVNIKSGSSSGTQYAELATTSPGTGTLAVGRYKATPPSLTDGQLYGLQLDTSGNLKVTGSLSVGGTTDNSAFTAGTSTGTPSMGFYHSTIDTVTDGRAAALAIDSKRNLLNVIRDAAGNARGANVTASNELLVSVNNASLAVTGTFWQATQPVSGTVTANAGTNLNTSALALETGGNLASIKTDVDNLNLAQGSTTSGQKGNLTLGAVTTAAPTYTTAQSSPLSLTTAGALRVDASGTTVPVSGTFWQATQPVSLATNTPTLQSGSTTAVTQATGTNLHTVVDSGTVTNLSQLGGAAIAMGTGVRTAGTQRVTIATDDSVPVTGTFWQATQPVSGTVTTSPPSNASSNVSQINGVTPLMGNGITGTGSLRVTIASDNTAFAVNSTLSAETTKVIGTVNIAAAQTIAVTNAGTFATQSTLAAETTKVIGVVRTADGSGNLYSTNSTTYTAKFAQDGNLLGTLGTAFSTAGKVDVKGADGDVFVRQATGTNLHTVLDSGTLTSITNSVTVTATNLSTNLAQVNGVTTLAGNGTSGTGAQRVTIASDSTGQVAPAANATSTGVSINYQAALTNSKVAVKASAGNVYGYRIYNPNTTWVYIQFFNVASASVTLGTTAPTDVVPCPPGGLIDEKFAIPDTYGTAITVAATTTASGLTAPTSTLVATFRYA